ncbi:hypothetical protein KF728_09745 [Candidatus Obscuribacterales bacterium]|nr:hypothetical protein [Candidatus Obscuribacterales bacterium]
MANLPEGATTTTNFWSLHELAKHLQIPNELTDLPGSINNVRADELIAGALAYIFEIDEFQHSPAAVKTLYPNLKRDDDGLIVNIESGHRFTKDGLLTQTHFVPYDDWLSSKPTPKSLSFGFVETLLGRMSQKDVNYFGLRLEDDIVMDKRFHLELETRVHAWGPTNLNDSKLLDPYFPVNPSGTVTTHIRTDDTAFLRLMFFGLSRVEIMWSRRENLKTIQIEELMEPDSYKFEDCDEIPIMYLHSIWNCEKRRFVHLDGAVKGYARPVYDKRLEVPMNKFSLRANSYRKLFRIDASLQVNEWADLITKFFYLNELIVEYFSAILSDQVVTLTES